MKLAVAIAAFLYSAFGSVAAELEILDPSAETVSISIEALDLEPQIEFTTTTIWTDGAQTFSGVPLSRILEMSGTQGICDGNVLDARYIEPI